MRLFRKFGSQREKREYIIKAAIIFVVLFVISIVIDFGVKPVMNEVSVHQAKAMATEVVNNAVYSELVGTEYTYANFVNLSQDKDGNVTSLETDVTSINRLKTKLTKRLVEDFEILSSQELKIPAGTLLGPYFLSGKGPGIPYKVVYAGDLDISFSNRFESAGINQTRHQIILTITFDVSSILPGNTTTVSIPTSYYIANTVIVGQVPESFTDLSFDEDFPLDDEEKYDISKRSLYLK